MASASLPPPASGGHSASPPVIKIVNLHQAYQGALPLAHHGPIMGELRPRGRRATAKGARGPANCVEPNCNLVYNSGPVQHTPHVYLLLWGPSWNSASPDTKYLSSFYQGLGAGPQDTWSTITSQYSDGSGHPAFGGSVLQGVYQDTTSPPADVSQADLTAEADAFVTNQSITDRADAQVVIASQAGTCFGDGFAGNPSGCSTPAGGYCAWHTNSSLGETFTNLPYQLDAGSGCGQNFINSGSAGTYDGFSIVGGHEYAETITDPAPVSGWFDSSDNVSGGEIGDKCAWGGGNWGGSDPAGDVTLSTGTFAMQSLWSNAAGSCVMAASVASPPVVTGVSPSQGPAAGGTAVTVTGTSLSGGTVAFGSKAATGVSCGATSCTVRSPAGTGTVDVRVATTAGTSATGSADKFTYTSAPPSGPITGYGGKCVADVGPIAHSGNPVELWTCNGTSGQKWTIEPDSALRVGGNCMTVVGTRTANGTQVNVVPCNGTWQQAWSHPSNGELVDPHSGRCLTDPGNRTANGTQLVLWSCTDAANQRWSIP